MVLIPIDIYARARVCDINSLVSLLRYSPRKEKQHSQAAMGTFKDVEF